MRRAGGKQKSAVPLPAAAMFECLLIRSYPAIHSSCLCSSLDLPPSLPEPPTDPADSKKLHHLRVEEETGVEHKELNTSLNKKVISLRLLYPFGNFPFIFPRPLFQSLNNIDQRSCLRILLPKYCATIPALNSASWLRSYFTSVCQRI